MRRSQHQLAEVVAQAAAIVGRDASVLLQVPPRPLTSDVATAVYRSLTTRLVTDRRSQVDGDEQVAHLAGSRREACKDHCPQCEALPHLCTSRLRWRRPHPGRHPGLPAPAPARQRARNRSGQRRVRSFRASTPRRWHRRGPCLDALRKALAWQASFQPSDVRCAAARTS
jgi:hypothetical protein